MAVIRGYKKKPKTIHDMIKKGYTSLHKRNSGHAELGGSRIASHSAQPHHAQGPQLEMGDSNKSFKEKQNEKRLSAKG